MRDDDGDTPLYTVETLETAKFLIDSGADCNRRNLEGLTVRSETCIYGELIYIPSLRNIYLKTILKYLSICSPSLSHM